MWKLREKNKQKRKKLVVDVFVEIEKRHMVEKDSSVGDQGVWGACFAIYRTFQGKD